MHLKFLVVFTAILSLVVGNKLQCYDCVSYNNVEECQANISSTLICEHTCLQASFWIEVTHLTHQNIYARGCGPANGCDKLEKGYLAESRNYTCSACAGDLCNDTPFKLAEKENRSNKPCVHYMFD